MILEVGLLYIRDGQEDKFKLDIPKKGHQCPRISSVQFNCEDLKVLATLADCLNEINEAGVSRKRL